MDNSDSDDFLSGPPTKLSKLSRKKKTTKEKKVMTSTQRQGDSLFSPSRSGRAARKDMEEERFQKELEEAIRLSSEDGCSLSSADLVPGSNINQELINIDSEDSQSNNTVEVIRETELIQKRKIEELDTQSPPVKQSPATVKVEDKSSIKEPINPKLPAPVQIQPSPTKENRRTRNKKKRVVESSDDDDDFDDAVDVNDDLEEDEWEEKPKQPAKSKAKPPKKNPTRDKKAKTKVSEESSSAAPSSAVSPLSDHNRLAALPKCPNMFQAKSPVRVRKTPKKESPAPAPVTKVPAAPSPHTPGLSSSLANILGKMSSSKPSSPASSVKTPRTPVQRKLPNWTPPSRVGTPGSSKNTPLASPSTGLRLGLSRNYKTKPLHPSIKS